MELHATEALLEQLEGGQFIERHGLLQRVAELKEELTRASDDRWKALLVFGGAPVKARRGIEAEFAATAVSGYQDLVSRVGAASSNGSARADDFRLRIVDVARGSFGFEFEQLGDEGKAVEVESAVNAATELIHRMSESEDVMAEALAEVEPRVAKSLQAFVGQIAKAGASLKVETPRWVLSLSTEDVIQVAERMSATQTETTDVQIVCELIGFLPKTGIFELLDDNAAVIKGKFGTAPDAGLINRRCIASLRVTTVTRPTRGPKSAYFLLGIREASEPPSEDSPETED